MVTRVGFAFVLLGNFNSGHPEWFKHLGYPERFVQEALGHNSKVVPRAYARKAKVKLPSLESYERQATDGRIIRFYIFATPAMRSIVSEVVQSALAIKRQLIMAA